MASESSGLSCWLAPAGADDAGCDERTEADAVSASEEDGRVDELAAAGGLSLLPLLLPPVMCECRSTSNGTIFTPAGSKSSSVIFALLRVSDTSTERRDWSAELENSEGSFRACRKRSTTARAKPDFSTRDMICA